MDTKKQFERVLLAAGVCFLSVLVYSNAFARDDDRRGKQRHEVVEVRHERYNYHDGRFYKPSWFGLEFFLDTPPIGAIVRVLPFGSTRITVGGIQYLHYDRVYYQPCTSGYIVVPEPVVLSNVVYVNGDNQYNQALSGERVTINVPNSNGSYTPVTLIKRNNGYIGPQGEYYTTHPTIEQLKALYSN